MPIEITMPRLSDTMEVGTVIKWNVKEGDAVSAGDVLADIETDKATMELQAYDDGTVAKIMAKEGDNIEVGKPILILAEEGEDIEEAASAAGSAKSESKKSAAISDNKPGAKTEAATAVAEPPARTNGAGAATITGAGGRIFASPLARKIAEEKGVDLSTLHGSGPSGRIVVKDVEAAVGGVATPTTAPSAGAPAPAAAPRLEARIVPLSNMRRTIAKVLTQAKTTIPHYQVTMSVDMDALLSLRKQLNEQLAAQGVKISVNDFIVRACALAMHPHPFVNSVFKGDAVDIKGDVNIGVAIAIPIEKGGGLVVATLRHADQMGLRQISAETRRLAEKARTKGLTVEEMADSTFTISNLGMYGVEHFNAIINPPNTAILATAGAIEKTVVRDGQIVIGHEMQMTMSSDHRVIDGAMAADYLNTVKSYLQAPATLLV